MAKEPKQPRVKIVDDPERLSVPAGRLMDRLGDGKLCRHFVEDERIPAGVAYWVEPGGKKADREAAEELIRKGRVVAQADALFADCAQSFVAAAPLPKPLTVHVYGAPIVLSGATLAATWDYFAAECRALAKAALEGEFFVRNPAGYAADLEAEAKQFDAREGRMSATFVQQAVAIQTGQCVPLLGDGRRGAA